MRRVPRAVWVTLLVVPLALLRCCKRCVHRGTAAHCASPLLQPAAMGNAASTAHHAGGHGGASPATASFAVSQSGVPLSVPSTIIVPFAGTTTIPTVAKHTCACAHMHPGRSCLSFVVTSFGRSFYLAYGIRAGISLALHVIALARGQPRKLLDLSALVAASGLPLDAVRMGLFFGSFTGAYNAIRCMLARFTGRDDAYTVMGAGTVAGLSILFQAPDMHRTLALYIWARVFQCWYNKSKLEGKWHLWGSDWAHGDSLLFSLCSAQVMYAYVMRPDTLPKAYHSFIVNTGPIPLQVLQQVKANNRGLPVDMAVLKAVYEKLAPRATVAAKPIEGILAKLATDAYGPTASALLPPLLPCSILHPHNASCSHQWAETFINGAKRTLPVYASLTFVPMIVLRFWQVVKHPLDQLQRGLWSITKSTSFLSSFVTLYMMMVCTHRRTFTRDHRSLYWFAGFVSSWTILLEQKSRRSELALYVLPRAIDSLFQTLQSRQLLAQVPHAEKGLFCLGMGALMYYRHYAPQSMSPLLARVLGFFVPTYRPQDVLTAEAKSHDHPAKELASPPHMLRAESSDTVIPLPEPGIPLAREQSEVWTVDMAHDGPTLSVAPSASYNLLPNDLSPTTPDAPHHHQLAVSATVVTDEVAPSPIDSSSTLDVDGDFTAERTRGGSTFVAEKVDAIESSLAAEQALLAAQSQAAHSQVAHSNGNGSSTVAAAAASVDEANVEAEAELEAVFEDVLAAAPSTAATATTTSGSTNGRGKKNKRKNAN